MQTLLKLVAEGGASPSTATELASVERAAVDFVREAKSIEVLLQNLDAPPTPAAALQREIAELEAELKEKNALIATVEARLGHWGGVFEQQNREAQAVLDGTET